MTSDDAVRRALAALASADKSRGAPAHVERQVLDAFDRQTRRADLDAPRRRLPVARRALVPLTLAATLAFAICVEWGRRTFMSLPAVTGASRRAPNITIRAAPVAPAETAQAIVRNHAAGSSFDTLRTSEATRRARQARSAGRRAAVVTEAAVLSARLDGGEFAHVVRARIPRAMLPLLGVPIVTIDPDAPGTIDVELLLGEDGLARTIQIIR
jgi:hypothetical protein